MPSELTLCCHPKLLWKFNPMLQKGVQVKCRVNGSLMDLLKEDFDLKDDYIRRRIQTITLDGKPVDDLQCAMVHHNDTLAISGAMPGLVGAILRKDGFYAAMRDTISYCANHQTNSKSQTGRITVKLFNLILKDQSEAFLSRGIGMTGKDLVPLLDEIIEPQSKMTGLSAASGELLDWPATRENYVKVPLLFVTVISSAARWEIDLQPWA